MLVTSHRSSVRDAIAAAIAYGVGSSGADIVAFHGMIALSQSSFDGNFARQSVVRSCARRQLRLVLCQGLRCRSLHRGPVGVLPQR
jgi:hypothetical protein